MVRVDGKKVGPRPKGEGDDDGRRSLQATVKYAPDRSRLERSVSSEGREDGQSVNGFASMERNPRDGSVSMEREGGHGPEETRGGQGGRSG